jgi:hypothetical protein
VTYVAAQHAAHACVLDPVAASRAEFVSNGFAVVVVRVEGPAAERMAVAERVAALLNGDPDPVWGPECQALAIERFGGGAWAWESERAYRAGLAFYENVDGEEADEEVRELRRRAAEIRGGAR